MHIHTRCLSILALLALGPGLRADSLNGLRSSVTRVRDANGDGVPDLAVASRDRNRPERVWILSGKDGSRLLEIHGRETGDRFGSEVVALGDWDGDGSPDLAIEALSRTGDGPWRRGYRRVVSTKTGLTLLEMDSVGALGDARDVDGDGKLDLLISDESVEPVAITVLSGVDRRVILAVELGKRVFARGIEALAWIDDLDGDGRRDFCAVVSTDVRTRDFNGVECEITGRSGRDGKVIWRRTLVPDSEGNHVTVRRFQRSGSDGPFALLVGVEDHVIQILREQDGEPLHTRKALRAMLYSYASSLDVVGDIDRDGWEDWILGANESWGDFFDAGLCLVVSGKTGEVLHSLKEDERFGYDACGLGDVNGDHVPDFAVGAERQRGWTATDDSEPCVQVRSGKDASVLWMKRHVDLRK